MSMIWRVTDSLKGVTIHFEKKPYVRKYMLENKHHDHIEVMEIKWNYKSQLLQIINGAYAVGRLDEVRFAVGRD